jgi:receptor protein-tyrosine kinase
MSIVEEATRRLEQLARAGVAVPWSAAGVQNGDLQARVENGTRAVGGVAAVRPVPVGAPPAGAPVRELPQRARFTPARPKSTVALDFSALEAAGHLVPGQTRTPLADEFGQVKRPLITNARLADAVARRLALIMVTSAMPGEGKTFCAINLAMSIAAEIDLSVLLVEADVVRPSLLSYLGLPPGPGLLDVIADPTLDLSRVVLETNVPKLSLLPAGSPNAMSTELLASAAMEQLLSSLAEGAGERVVIFDTPPLLLTNEAQVLASRVGQVVLVVEAGGTPRQSVGQALAMLEHCPLILPLLNKARTSRLPRGYGYAYAPQAAAGPVRRQRR